MASSNPDPSFYSQADLSRLFQLPESTIRYYCGRFANFLPCQVEGRKSLYAAPCLEVLKFIRANMTKARTSSNLEKLLAANFPQHAVPGKSGKPDKSEKPGKPGNAQPATIPDRFDQCSPPGNQLNPQLNLQANFQDDDPRAAILLLDRQTRALERIANSLERITPLPGDEAQADAAKTAERFGLGEPTSFQAYGQNSGQALPLDSLWKEVRDLRILIKTSEQTQQEDLEQLRTLLIRLAHQNSQ